MGLKNGGLNNGVVLKRGFIVTLNSRKSLRIYKTYCLHTDLFCCFALSWDCI